MATFADIQAEIGSMLDMADDLTPEQREAMDAYLDMLGRQEADKVDSFAQFIKLESDRAEAIKDESRRLAARAKTAENRIAYLKNRYRDIMLQNGLKQVAGNVYKISMRRSESVVAPDDPAALPPLYQRRKEIIEADKAAIRESLKDGVPVEGCKLVESYSLQIR